MVSNGKGNMALLNSRGEVVAALQEETVLAPRRVYLRTGLSLWSRTVQEEYLTQLSPWSKAAKVFQEMGDDIVIGALLESAKTPLLASDFEVNAASEQEQDKDAAAWLLDNLMNMPDLEWFQHVEDALEFLDFGWAVTEKVAEKREDGRLWLLDLVPIGQETQDGWGPSDERGRVSTFMQRDNLGVSRTAPLEKLLHFVFRGRKRNPLGRSLLRGLYRAWYFKKNLEALEAIGVERDVGNAPVAELDKDRTYQAGEISSLEKGLEAFRMDETLYVILPPGVKLTAYGGGNKVYNVREIIRDYQHLIRQRFFADFLSLGSEQVGTQALAREMTTFFSLALRSIQNRMLSVWNRQLVRWLFSINNMSITSSRVVSVAGLPPSNHRTGSGAVSSLPTLDWLPPGNHNLQSLAQAYNTLVGAELITPDMELENRIRKILNIPPVDEDVRRKAEEERRQKLPIGGQQQVGATKED